jgi:3-oxoacyl-[acyl-carrier protein] reductase
MITPTIPSENSLVNKVSLVTGGTRGIGRAIAKMLLTEGAEVAICGRSQELVDAAVRELAAETGGKVKGKVADVKSHEQVGELFQFIDTHFGGLDVLVNNAGIGVFRPVQDLTLEEWRSTIDTNLSGVFYCSREALFRFVTKGGGYIVNISSLAGANAFAGGSAYNASKFGLTGFSEAMMQDVRSENVRVSYVMPGSVATGFSSVPGGHGADGDVSNWKIWPEDVAEIVRMLLKMPVRTLINRVEVRPLKTSKAGPKR